VEELYDGTERRQFIRLDCVMPLVYKVCKEETISKLMEGYTANLSESGLLCSIKDKVSEGDILWLSFDRSTLSMCTQLERKSLIYQSGIIGKVVRLEPSENDVFRVGIQFLTREEKNLSHIYSKIDFLNDKGSKQESEEE